MPQTLLEIFHFPNNAFDSLLAVTVLLFQLQVCLIVLFEQIQLDLEVFGLLLVSFSLDS